MHIHSISPFQDRIALTDQDRIALTDQDRRQLKRLLSASAVKVIVSLIDISSVYWHLIVWLAAWLTVDGVIAK